MPTKALHVDALKEPHAAKSECVNTMLRLHEHITGAIWGGGQFRIVTIFCIYAEYRYNHILREIIWDTNKVIDIGV